MSIHYLSMWSKPCKISKSQSHCLADEDGAKNTEGRFSINNERADHSVLEITKGGCGNFSTCSKFAIEKVLTDPSFLFGNVEIAIDSNT